ncbi:MAG: hypothetical protein Q9181_001251 [Wetmoreana brouardii]
MRNVRRGARSKSTVKLEELPQGVLDPLPSTGEGEDDGPTYPTVVRQARNNMRKFDNCVVLTRVGSFYELYFEQAVEYGPLLNLKVAQKRCKVGVPSVAMAGFPFFQLDRFLKILVQDLNKYVAISEEFANDASSKVKSGGLMFDRRVTRIITPGTLIDEKFVDPYENNFLLAVHPLETVADPHHAVNQPAELRNRVLDAELSSVRVGLAWLDLSTGDFLTQATSLGTLPSALARIGAKEVVISDLIGRTLQHSIATMVEHDRRLLTYHAGQHITLPISAWSTMLESPVPAVTEATFSQEETSAGSLLLTYVADKLQGLNIKLQPPQRRQVFETMNIDKNSLKGLEVLATSKEGLDGGKGSLLHAMRRTATKSGSRLLKDWIASPSTSLPVINARLDLVSELLDGVQLREDIVGELRRSSDCQRLVQRFSMGRGDADDLLSLLKTIETTSAIADILAKSSCESAPPEDRNPAVGFPLQNLFQRFSLKDPQALAIQISNAIDEEGLVQSHRKEENDSAKYIAAAQGVLHSEGTSADLDDMSSVVRAKVAQQDPSEQEAEDEESWVMRKTASPSLQSLHNSLSELRHQREHLTMVLRDEIGIAPSATVLLCTSADSVAGAQSLALRYVAGSGHVCHVKGAKDVRLSAKAALGGRGGRATKSTRTFYNTDWSNLGAKMDLLKFQIRAEEQHVLQTLREQVIVNLVKLRRNAAVLDELDIGCAFATLAEEQGFVRPILNTSRDHKIVGGRHPTVKIGLEEEGRAFVGNDCFVGEKERIWLITGPNMGGKSTFLRQNALISILAQTGSFVPAEHAELGIVDQLFTRVGSADDLFRDQSTFMVEMLETAVILNQATSRSFVIMDEIGRGTTPEDGVAVAFACLHHLYHHNQCRALFATHFHVLADLAKDFDHLACYCTNVAEGPSGSFSYVHRLQKGVNRASHALKVARLAGIPEPAIQTAETILARLGAVSAPISGTNRPTSTDTKVETNDFKHARQSDRELGWRGEIEYQSNLESQYQINLEMTSRISAIFGASQPFDPTHRYTTSWILPPTFLAIIRVLLSVYAFISIFFVFGWDGAHRRHDLSRHSFSLFTDLTYWAIAFYFLFSSLHTFSYAQTGRSWLQKWPVALQIAHAVFYTSIVTFPILVTAVFWAILYSGTWFLNDFDGWSNTSKHALNTVFAAFEIIFTRTSPPPVAHLPILVIILALYLSLAYLTHATAGFYPYSFLDPKKGSGKLAGYILGILAAACVIFGIVWAVIWARRWLTEKKMGMHGKFVKGSSVTDEEMVEVTRERMK